MLNQGFTIRRLARGTPPPHPDTQAEHDDPNKTGAPDDGRRDARRLHHSLAAFWYDVVFSQVLDHARAGVLRPVPTPTVKPRRQVPQFMCRFIDASEPILARRVE